MTALLLGLAACVSLGRNSLEVSAEAQCAADFAGQWLRGDHHLDSLLLMGDVEDPATTGGAFIPAHSFLTPGGEPEVWMDRTGLKQIDMYVRPSQNASHLYGPKEGDPEGVYRFERRPAGSPDCADYDAARLAAAAGGAVNRFVGCVAWRYLGTYRPGGYAATYIIFEDASYRSSNIDRTEYRLVGPGGEVIARGGHYTYREMRQGLPTCFARSGGVEWLFQQPGARP